MQIYNSDILISAVEKKQFPTDNLSEIAFVGRSNVGKSSLINTLTNRKSLARTSNTPGKTRLINFFTINQPTHQLALEPFYFVDLPGYGYAKITKEEYQKWGKMIEEYLKDRPQLKLVLLLLDIRRTPNDDDFAMINWLKYYDVPYAIVATKCDKLNKTELNKQMNVMKSLQMDIFPFSSLKKQGVDELLKYIEERLQNN